jgi:heat shock protein HtpX
LRKIENRGELPGATSAIMELCLDNPREGFSDLFATHPSVEARIAALVKFAGGRDPGPLPLPPPASADDQSFPADNLPPPPKGPWSDSDDATGAPPSAPPGPWSDRVGPWGRH